MDGACGSSNRRDAHTVRSEGRQSKAAWLFPWTSFYLGPWWKVPSTLQESLLPSVNPSWRAFMYPPTGMSLQCSQIPSNQQPTLATIVLVTKSLKYSFLFLSSCLLSSLIASSDNLPQIPLYIQSIRMLWEGWESQISVLLMLA